MAIFFIYRRKSNELNKIISDCEFNIKKNNKIIAKNQKIADNLMDVKKKIQVTFSKIKLCVLQKSNAYLYNKMN